MAENGQIAVELVNELNVKFASSKFFGKVQPSYEGGNITSVKVELTLKSDGLKKLIDILK